MRATTNLTRLAVSFTQHIRVSPSALYLYKKRNTHYTMCDYYRVCSIFLFVFSKVTRLYVLSNNMDTLNK